MPWNWEQPGWPHFRYDASTLIPFEQEFLRQSGEFVGAFKHIGSDDRDVLRIELIGDEALKTSQIEGEILDRNSVQSSLRQQFGLKTDNRRIGDAERGIAEMMVALYRTFAEPLSHDMLCTWHRMLLDGGRRRIRTIGDYRTHDEPMQIVSGNVLDPNVHFEAPPSSRVRKEMKGFTSWFNATSPSGKQSLPALTRAGLSHLYFVSIHPFEDGNGRIGRAISEKSLAQNLKSPSLIALAYTIERGRKDYYAALERNNRGVEVTDWLHYFAQVVLEAQRNTIRRVEFYIAKARFYEKYRSGLNSRQSKVVERMFREGLDGFKGGLSAENYIAIAKTSRATATRDLQNLVSQGVLTRSGELRHTRYALALGDL